MVIYMYVFKFFLKFDWIFFCEYLLWNSFGNYRLGGDGGDGGGGGAVSWNILGISRIILWRIHPFFSMSEWKSQGMIASWNKIKSNSFCYCCCCCCHFPHISEWISADSPRDSTELDAEVFLCRSFAVSRKIPPSSSSERISLLDSWARGSRDSSESIVAWSSSTFNSQLWLCASSHFLCELLMKLMRRRAPLRGGRRDRRLGAGGRRKRRRPKRMTMALTCFRWWNIWHGFLAPTSAQVHTDKTRRHTILGWGLQPFQLWVGDMAGRLLEIMEKVNAGQLSGSSVRANTDSLSAHRRRQRQMTLVFNRVYFSFYAFSHAWQTYTIKKEQKKKRGEGNSIFSCLYVCVCVSMCVCVCV